MVRQIWPWRRRHWCSPRPAAAQFSESYNFLKAVRKRTAPRPPKALDKPGNTIVNTRDGDTGDTALHIVTKRSDAAWMGFMMQKGANINATDGDGNTPLMIAAISRFTEGVDLLIRIKAQVDVQNRLGETALLKAVQNRDLPAGQAADRSRRQPRYHRQQRQFGARARRTADPRAASIAKLFKDMPVRAPRPCRGRRFRTRIASLAGRALPRCA